jgi:hypothetical protein
MDTKRVIRRVLAALAVPAAASAVLASTAGAASAATTSAANPPPPSVYSTDTGWVTDYNGYCAVEAHVDYYPGSDTAYIHTTVRDPYLFAACRVHTNVWVDTKNDVFQGATQGAMACAVLDPTCASTLSYTGTYSGQTPGLTALVDTVNQALIDAGLPPTYTRAQATTGIQVSFSNG